MADARARKKGELPPILHCSICNKPLKPTSQGKAYAAGLCFYHWSQTDEGKRDLKEKRNRRRSQGKAPTPFRYFGSLPGEEGWPEGPFNRIRLAVSSTYAGRNKPRGPLFIIWSDDQVTRHEGIKQADVAGIKQSDGEIVDRSDLTLLAKTTDPLVERVRHYGKGDTYLV
tara:strand:- start:377 stop:886 length:510 start_codon:yes stop_codon:yes gene_type:complete